MQIFAVILVLQMAIAGALLYTPLQPHSFLHHAAQTVLGAHLLAQDTTTDISQDSQDSPTDTPTPTDAPSITDTPTPTPQDTAAQQPIIPQDASALPPEETSLLNTDTTDISTPPDASATMTPTPSMEDTTTTSSSSPTTIPTPQPQSGASQTQAPEDTLVSDNAATTANAVTAKSPTVSTAITAQAQQQDSEIQQATTPQDKTQSLVQSAKENVIAMNDVLTQHDYATASFLTQRITDEISKAITTSPIADNTQTTKNLQLFCKQANLSLLTEQLLLPESMEQDVEIARGMCQTIQ